MAEHDNDVPTTSDVESNGKPRRYGRANTTYTVKKKNMTKEIKETHDSIDQQIEAYLNSGKKIQKISHGVSGLPDVQSGGRRHIYLGNKYKTA